MANPQQELEVLVDILNSKRDAQGLLAAVEEIVKFVAEISDENDKTQAKLVELATTEVQSAIKRIRDGADGADGRDGIDGRDGTDGKDGRDGRDGKDGTDGKNGKDGRGGSPDTGDDIIGKINKSALTIAAERVQGLPDAIRNMVANASVGITTSFFNGLRAKNLTINGATAVQRGDTVFMTVSGSGGGQVNSVIAGTNITVDSTDPANPVVSATASSSPHTPPETPDSSTTVFTVSAKPSSVVSDGVTYFEGFGYSYSSLQITLDIAPSSYIRYYL